MILILSKPEPEILKTTRSASSNRKRLLIMKDILQQSQKKITEKN